ncbi:MAG: 16S rRNA (uracil(1498)-N(3))-methyltransferase, partial [Eggerthellaceae bacterium]|nr:16S rRNA (uracil(1498)-N(3))-methyltransferase [Eggerthellaceae bacterium]
PLTRALEAEFCPAADARVAIVIGPEGCLEAAEVERIQTMTKHPAVVTLGNTILRTETAGVVAPALVIHELNRLAKGSRA